MIGTKKHPGFLLVGIHSPCSKRTWPTHADSLPGDHSRQLLVEGTSALDGQHIPILSCFNQHERAEEADKRRVFTLTKAFIYYVLLCNFWNLNMFKTQTHKHTHTHTLHTFCDKWECSGLRRQHAKVLLTTEMLSPNVLPLPTSKRGWYSLEVRSQCLQNPSVLRQGNKGGARRWSPQLLVTRPGWIDVYLIVFDIKL